MSEDVTVLSTQHDKVGRNAVWCPCLQICWEMLLNLTNRGQAVAPAQFGEGEAIVRNLNRKESHKENAGASHLYAYSGPMSEQALKRVADTLARRFKQTSDILGDLDPDPSALLLYSFLFADFRFWVPFLADTRANPENPGGRFGSLDRGNEATGVHYFGIESKWETQDDPWTARDIRQEQCHAMFYDDEGHHAVAIMSRTGDMVILARGLAGGSLAEMWDDLIKRTSRYDKVLSQYDDGTRELRNSRLRCPRLSVSARHRYEEIEHKSFRTKDGNPWVIDMAVQSVSLSLDENGGTVKGEAVIVDRLGGMFHPPTKPPMPFRDFSYDDEFTLFVANMQEVANWGRDTKGHSKLMGLVRQGAGTMDAIQRSETSRQMMLGIPFPMSFASAYPYFAAHVTDITAFQDGARPVGE